MCRSRLSLSVDIYYLHLYDDKCQRQVNMTFACHFYDGITDTVLCERGR